MNQQIFSKNTLGRSNQYIHALSIILASLIIQICCSLIPFGHWVGKAEGLAGDPWKAQYPPVEAGYLNDIWAVSADNIFAVGFNINGGAFIGHYDGQVWKYMEASILGEPFAELKAIWGSSINDVYAVGGKNDTETLILHYNGVEWSVVNHNFSGYLFDLWGSGPDDVFAVGVEGLIIHWDGESWNEMDSSTSIYLKGVWGDGQNKVYAVGEGSILLYENGSWNTLSGIPACSYLTDIWGISGGDVFAVGDCILQYHGGQWSDVTPYNDFDDFQLYKIVGKSENEIMTVGSVGPTRVGYNLLGEEGLIKEGLIIRYEGQTWQIEDNPAGGPFPADLRGGWIGDQGKAIVVGGSVDYYDSYGYYEPTTRGIFLSFDGASWSVEPPEEYYNGALYQIWARSSQDIYAVGGYPYDWGDAYYLPAQKLARSFIAHYDGDKWSRIEVEEDGVLYDIWGSDGELFAVGGEISGDEDFGWDFIGGQIFHSIDGINWQIMSNDFDGFFHGVWGSSPQNVFAIGNSLDDFYGSIYQFNGNTWEEMGGPFDDMELTDIWGYDADNIFVVGWDWDETQKGIILYYDGAAWTIMNHDIYDDFYRVWGTSPDDVFAAGANGIYHYDGQTWSQSFSGGYFDDVWGTSPTDVFAIGDDGILHYNGAEWQDTGFIPVSGVFLFGIGGTSSDDVYIVGDYGRIYHYEKEQSGRQKIFLREGWNLISFQVNVCLHEQQALLEAPLPEGIEFRQVGDMSSWLSDGVNSPIRDAQNPAEAGDWQRITSFDLNGAHMVDKDMPSFVNDLDYLSAGYGYWIKMNAPGYLLLEGSLLPSSVSLPLREGWNLIGSLSPDICYYDDTVLYDGEDKPSCIVSEIPSVTFESVTGGLVQSVFDSIDGKYRRVTAFYCDGAKMYDTQVPAFVCDLYYQAPGCGYWIKMTAEGTLTSP